MNSLCTEEKKKAHALVIPFPAQGHITPMLKLAKLLHSRGLHITFVNTEFNHKRFLKSHGPDSLNGLSSFRFEKIPDGLPESDADATQDIVAVCDSIRKNFLAPFRNLVSKLNDALDAPPVTIIVSDANLVFTSTVAKEFGISEVIFWTASACGLLGYLQFTPLIEKGLVPLKDVSDLTDGYLETVIDWVPGIKDMALRDVPSFIRTTTLDDDVMVIFFQEVCWRAEQGSAVIVNTFDALEKDVLDALSSIMPPIYTIGSLTLLLNQAMDKDVNIVKSNLWKEERDCLKWLDTKEAKSVIYVNFGSITTMTSEDLVEFAWGLANSHKAFFWVIRPDIVGGANAILPPEFPIETKNRGFLSSWCPQEEVLSHPAVGGFLTHSGWNSTLDSLCNGVPMICWPFFAEQPTNRRFCCKEWGVGLEIEGDVVRDKVESLVRELMDGHKGKEMTKKALGWKQLAQDAINHSRGSSILNFDKLFSQVFTP